jgi:2-polyprenyl-6-methoxyphenol hydroxylase-like FAD-dependent oxidoreductase
MTYHNAQKSVGIAGGGIGGLALAILLRKAGHPVTVFEARNREELAEGVFLTLAPNGMNALRLIGADGEVAENGIATTAIEILDERGRRLALMDQLDHAEVYGAESVTIRRGTLAEILVRKAEDAGVSLRFGQRIGAVIDSADGVEVETVEGGRAHFDMLAACDGLRSSVRELVFPEYPKPHFTGLNGAGGFVDVPELAPTHGTMRMTFGREAFFGYIKAPGQPAFWFNSYPADSIAPDDASPEAYARSLRHLHRDDPRENREILARLTQIDRDYPIFDMPPLPVWHSGNVVLVGDSAHAVGPHAGQGASMAIEDAMVLAACLAAETSSTAAFSRYEKLRRGRVAEIVKQTSRNASQKSARGRLGLFIRNLILPFVIPLGIKTARRFYAYRVDRDPLAMPAR